MTDHDDGALLNLFGQEAKSAKLSEEAMRQHANDLATVMDTAGGRRWMWVTLGRCGIFRVSFNTNAMQTAFREGERNVALMLVADITTACPKLVAKMVAENTDVDGRNANANGNGIHDAD